MIPKIAANFKTTLSDELAVGNGLTFEVDSLATKHGDLDEDWYAITIDEGTTSEEHIIAELVDGVFDISVRDVDVQDGETQMSTGKKHRVGAEVKITNFALVQIVRAMRGDMAIAGGSPLRYATEHTISDDRDIPDKAYVDAIATGESEIVLNQIVFTNENAGETIAEKDLIYFKESDQEWYKFDADDAAKSENVRLAIALGAGSDGSPITNGIMLMGRKSGFAGLTAGGKIYGSSTAGEITQTAPSAPAKVVHLGWALTTSVIMFDPRANQILNQSDKTRAEQVGRTGMIEMYAGSAAPTGWLICDGAEISRSTYADLFAVIGTAFGAGDGAATFNLPNFKGRSPVGAGTGEALEITFLDAAVNPATDVITVSSTAALRTGQKVALSNSGGALPAGLSAQDYYVIRVSATTIKLAASMVDANYGTPVVDITAAASGGTHKITVAALDALVLGEKGGQAYTTGVPAHNHTVNGEYESGGSGSGGTNGGDETAITANPTGIEDAGNYHPFVAVHIIIKT